jgi:hypothetical protein
MSTCGLLVRDASVEVLPCYHTWQRGGYPLCGEQIMVDDLFVRSMLVRCVPQMRGFHADMHTPGPSDHTCGQ